MFEVKLWHFILSIATSPMAVVSLLVVKRPPYKGIIEIVCSHFWVVKCYPPTEIAGIVPSPLMLMQNNFDPNLSCQLSLTNDQLHGYFWLLKILTLVLGTDPFNIYLELV